ncbi:acetyl-CoA carboxylase [Clostridiales bacterium PH28_bin88]|nr:acetyl-CoA carboxylase [Clostridiales bacterium PH28_bin88]
MSFKKVLISNRGEIAVRIIRACRELGIKTVAIYSEADSSSRHVSEADEAYCVGPAPPAASYLNIHHILAKAMVAHVDAIHPGYGFLSENPDFAAACEKYGFQFIGPRPATMALAGMKVAARETAVALGVPVVPGSPEPIRTMKEAFRTARELGYPVLIKPSAGGGGRGLRVARDEQELVECLASSQREASLSFAAAGILMEKYLEKARHVEVQILADHHGNAVHLGERDCTIQRRHQKLIEESPSPAVDEELRQRMVSAALRLATGINYTSAGTVEFILDQQGNFYFIEMNTRIQVEHPVTEMITGIDLIKEQIRIAAGKKLSFSQADVVRKGWALECRINAEDPERNFLPSPGTITFYQKPGGDGIRVDDYVYSGYTLPPFYDSLLGKVIAWGDTREEAISRMKKALGECRIEGIKTTMPFLQRVLNHPCFTRGEIYTTFAQALAASEQPRKLMGAGGING